MSVAGWKDIGDLVIGLVVKEPPFVQIAIALGTAFSLLMFVEGLRASFLPRRKPNARSATARNVQPSRPIKSAKISAIAPAANSIRIPKRGETSAKPHRAPRPQIRRHSPSTSAPAHQPQLPQVGSFEE